MKAQPTDLSPDYFGRRIYEQSYYRKVSRSRLKNTQADLQARPRGRGLDWEQKEALSIFDHLEQDTCTKNDFRYEGSLGEFFGVGQVFIAMGFKE